MRIAHISDIHFGSKFNPGAFDKAVDEINSTAVDVLVITGDIVDEGLLHEFETADEKLGAFNVQNRILCPGNHDYRNTGYLLLKDYLPLKHVFETKEAKLIVLKTARPDKDEGEVGYRQQLWMEKQFEGVDKVKIVLMHHHLVPIPDTGLERHTVIDAGDVLNSLKRSCVDLVLCGHKHRPWSWSFENIRIMHAGSLSDTRLRGFFHNSYNLVEVKGNRISCRVKIVGGRELGFEELRG